jgi:hypothetical protein
MGFTRGSELDDPEGLLSATKGARYMRQVRVAADQPLPVEAIKGLLLAAARVNLERGGSARRRSAAQPKRSSRAYSSLEKDGGGLGASSVSDGGWAP